MTAIAATAPLEDTPSESYGCADYAPPRQTLYVVSKERWLASVRYGALELKHRTLPMRRFPLLRVDRIVCGRNVDWLGSSLFECMAHGITITFADGRGQTLGYALPAVESGEPFHACMVRFAALPEAAERLDNWWRHRRMDVLVDWWIDYERQHPGTSGYYYDDMKRQYVYRGEVPARIGDALHPLCEAFVLGCLRRHGALPAYDALEGGRLSLLEGFAVLLWGRLNLESGALAVAAAGWALQLQFLEAWFCEHGLSVDGQIAALKHFLVGELRPWQ